jgi:hypothetical protein
MGEFFSGLIQNILADLLILAGFGVVAWLALARSRWRIIAAVLRLKRNGVSNIFLNRSEYVSRRPISVGQYIDSTRREFIYVGIYFSIATDQSRVDETIKALLQRRCNFTIVLLNPETTAESIRFLEEYLALSAGTLRGRIRHAIQHFRALRDSLAADTRSLLDIRLHQLPLTSSAFLRDSRDVNGSMLVDIKWYGMGRERSFGLEFVGSSVDGSLFDTVRSSFEAIVGRSTPLE